MTNCNFTYKHFAEIYKLAIDEGYQVITLADWFSGNYDANRKIVVSRVDVDDYVDRTRVLGSIFKELGIRSSFYFRLHAKDYNLLTYDNINIVKSLVAEGNEVGLHSEIEDVNHYCGIDSAEALRTEIALFESFFGIKMQGVASHDDFTPRNNLDFWKKHDPSEFGLKYEAYDERIWTTFDYISDSPKRSWKSYHKGKLNQGDTRCACEHVRAGAPYLYILSHSCYYYWKYIYESTLPLEQPISL